MPIALSQRNFCARHPEIDAYGGFVRDTDACGCALAAQSVQAATVSRSRSSIFFVHFVAHRDGNGLAGGQCACCRSASDRIGTVGVEAEQSDSCSRLPRAASAICDFRRCGPPAAQRAYLGSLHLIAVIFRSRRSRGCHRQPEQLLAHGGYGPTGGCSWLA